MREYENPNPPFISAILLFCRIFRHGINPLDLLINMAVVNFFWKWCEHVFRLKAICLTNRYLDSWILCLLNHRTERASSYALFVKLLIDVFWYSCSDHKNWLLIAICTILRWLETAIWITIPSISQISLATEIIDDKSIGSSICAAIFTMNHARYEFLDLPISEGGRISTVNQYKVFVFALRYLSLLHKANHRPYALIYMNLMVARLMLAIYSLCVTTWYGSM